MTTNFKMINITNKKETNRVAIAKGTIFLEKEAFELVKNKSLPKGDAISIAEISAIMSAKNTSLNLALCHPLPLDFVHIKHELNTEKFSVTLYGIVGTRGKTGVEMEALSAVSTGLLTIYDLCKMIHKELRITDIELIFKSGGKSGTFIIEYKFPFFLREFIPSQNSVDLSGINFAVITLIDRASKGLYEDKSGALLIRIIKEYGAHIQHYSLIPDEKEKLKNIILSLTELSQSLFIITSGGTGLSARDITPDALKEISQKEIPGIGEMLRQHGSQYTNFSWLSRVCAFEINNSIVVCLPGSEKATAECMDALLPLIPHMISVLNGKNH